MRKYIFIIELLNTSNNVISLGGGSFINEKIRKEVITNNISFWLSWNTTTLLNRIKKNKKRPIAFNLNTNELIELITKRSKIYSKAKFKINCNKLTKNEIVMCHDYLENELSIINPKIICLLGNTAYNSILHGKEITKNHGKLIHKNGRVYFITFHPAAIIYNQKLGKFFNDDIKKLVNILGKLNKKYKD